MARPRRDHNPEPQQLTLDDWADTVSRSVEYAQPVHPRTVRAGASASTGAVEAEREDLDGWTELAAATPRHHLPAAELLETPGALLTRSHLRELGLERRAVDAVFRALPVVALPGYSRPMIRAEQYLELVEEHTYRDDRVRSCHA
jgi:hypothetical protein